MNSKGDGGNGLISMMVKKMTGMVSRKNILLRIKKERGITPL